MTIHWNFHDLSWVVVGTAYFSYGAVEAIDDGVDVINDVENHVTVRGDTIYLLVYVELCSQLYAEQKTSP